MLQNKAKELGNTAKEAILHRTATTVAECHTNSEHESTVEDPPVIGVQDIDKHIVELSKKIEDLIPPPKPIHHNKDLCVQLPGVNSHELDDKGGNTRYSNQGSCQAHKGQQNVRQLQEKRHKAQVVHLNTFCQKMCAKLKLLKD